ncbi:hypothetical protein TNCV_3010251, partial [Trichonephila clavipes]
LAAIDEDLHLLGSPPGVLRDGRTYLLKNSSGRSPLTDGKMPCLLRYNWSRPINAESGRGKGLGRSENKRPETRRSWNLNYSKIP